ncbi:hypothetical protein K457DRAFT_137874 [Linnemannia elongata AG-77]|uniref:Uncharacterized protein n=1 Tax=Linnemannia elongata AG-77 TaxID=1314771 RepID=A0A197JYP4_9FUNG|nr:hypothetical protein K457DRAFT_137874 [Linnemannia elongata AG-77]
MSSPGIDQIRSWSSLPPLLGSPTCERSSYINSPAGAERSVPSVGAPLPLHYPSPQRQHDGIRKVTQRSQRLLPRVPKSSGTQSMGAAEGYGKVASNSNRPTGQRYWRLAVPSASATVVDD